MERDMIKDVFLKWSFWQWIMKMTNRGWGILIHKDVILQKKSADLSHFILGLDTFIPEILLSKRVDKLVYTKMLAYCISVKEDLMKDATFHYFMANEGSSVGLCCFNVNNFIFKSDFSVTHNYQGAIVNCYPFNIAMLLYIPQAGQYSTWSISCSFRLTVSGETRGILGIAGE